MLSITAGLSAAAGAEGKFKSLLGQFYAEAVGLRLPTQQYGAIRGRSSPSRSGPPVQRAYFPPNFRHVVQPKNADFVIGFTLDEAEHNLSDLPVYRVTRMGALLSVVVDHREYLAEERIAHQPLAGAAPRRAPNLAY